MMTYHHMYSGHQNHYLWGVFDDTTTSPCLEIVEEMYQEMDKVSITSATEKSVHFMYIDRSQVKSVSVCDYIQYLIMWTEINCLRKRHTLKQKCQNYSHILNERSHRFKCAGMSSDILISLTVGCLKMSYFGREY